MLSLYQLLVDRLKVVVLANVGLDLEADCLTQDAARKAELLRLAQDYEAEGLNEVAEEIRASMQTLQPDQPLSRSLPISTHLREPQSNTSNQEDLANGTMSSTQAIPLISQRSDSEEQQLQSNHEETPPLENSDQTHAQKNRKKRSTKK